MGHDPRMTSSHSSLPVQIKGLSSQIIKNLLFNSRLGHGACGCSKGASEAAPAPMEL